ncbi:hypothetical protein C8Q76DRAFT_386374 [Earliella scabrosa]|nr:hypothetical protein C8Q76DRAFT_386374 [Earliella scabrosa]
MSSSSSSSSSSSAASDSGRSSSSPHPRKRQRVSEKLADSDSESTSDDSSSSSDAQSDSDSAASDAEEDDTPVRSHAEQRRQRKKEQRALKGAVAASTDESGTKKGKEKVKNTADLPPSKLPKRQNSVWVGNLSFKTTPAALKAFFEGVGEITRIHMPTKMATGGPEGKGARKENRGFAYVDFATPDAKTIAITLSENPLDGRRLLIKDGDDFNGRPTPTAAAGEEGTETSAVSNLTGHTKTAQKILRMQKQPPGPTLFFGNLGFETTQESIRELLESHRAKDPAGGADADTKWIRKIRLGTFEDSGKCKGWAFVDFTTAEHATAALTNPRNHHLNGRKLVVEYASPDAVRRGGYGPPRTDKSKDQQARSGPGAKRDRRSQSQANGAAGRDEEDGGGEEDAAEEGERPAKRWRSEAQAGGAERGQRGRASKGDSAGRSRPRSKPGAALAMAKREVVSIVPSQGKKIVF